MDMRPFEEAFAAYARGFFRGEGDDYAHEVKLDHSLRVYAEARGLADAHGAALASAGVPRRAALLAGLFHDVGRFTQYARYKTFNDPASANHARLSVRVCLEQGFLASVPEAERRLVYGAIMLHNRRGVRRAADTPLGFLARLLRDADKLDIYTVMLDYFSAEGEKPAFMRLRTEEHPTAYSPGMLADLRGGRLASYADLRWSNDFKLLMLSWVHDLNLAASARAFLERDYVGRMAALLPPAPELADLPALLRAELARRAAP
ncbi:metal-dependent phosphohydrolase HD sub domain-containing protein [Desulfovibrio sp. X2]|uniref:HD domain-containing protein n=1 Tax=Desulfovibrio sp. X2 TaxID=941449 RepID=UPI0003589B92|nr:HD domain-containing protein [Desulfovibrio sp. X2]EPR42681.1 metal-dependent phosphohydrolase HD sub domain-containing protein [Desulfovibrio sp. X2]